MAKLVRPATEGTTSDEMQEYFERQVGDYETLAEHVVIDNEGLHRELIGALPFSPDASIRILDLGSGTGHGMSLTLERFPRAEVVGVDFSSKMNRRAEGLLGPQGRFTIVEADFTEPLSVESGSFDAVISAVAIHNVSHADKEALFGRIAEWLRPGGTFVNGDFYEGETPDVNAQLREVYEQYLRANLHGDELATWLRHAFEQDMPMKLSEQRQILEQLGFGGFDLCWTCNNEAVYAARLGSD